MFISFFIRAADWKIHQIECNVLEKRRRNNVTLKDIKLKDPNIQDLKAANIKDKAPPPAQGWKEMKIKRRREKIKKFLSTTFKNP